MSMAETGTDTDYGLMDARYAIYHAPPVNTLLKQLGDAWLGRDPDRDERVSFPVVGGLAPERLEAITAAPRRYGFHATLKAPFALREGTESGGLVDAVADFARNREPFDLRLEVGELGGFLALIPAEPSQALQDLAAAVVEHFDGFRAPLAEEDRARRRPERLSERERQHLDRWGYPYVFDRFEFHMTLTDRLDEPERGQVKAILEHAFAPVVRDPVRIDQIALFTQTHRVAPFRIVRRFTLGV